MKRSVVAAISLLACSAPGFAADMGVPTPSPVMATAFSWTGFYVGGHVGGGWSRFRSIDLGTPGATEDTTKANGFIGGAQLGFNYQIGAVVLGVEGDYSWSDIKIKDGGPFGGAGITAIGRNDYVAIAAGRVGYAFDRVLVYGKGGGAWTRDKADIRDGLGGTAFGRFNRSGWMAGGGVEYALLQNWSVKLEYDYLRFGAINETLTTTGGLAATPALVKLDMQLVKFGFNYRF